MRFDKITLDRMENGESLTFAVTGKTIELQRNDLVSIPDFSVVITLLSHSKNDALLRLQSDLIVVMKCANTLEDIPVNINLDEQICLTTSQLNDPTEELAYEITQNFIPMNAILTEIISLSLPIRVVKEDLKVQAGEGWQIIDPDEEVVKEQSPFANLSQKLSE